MYIRGDPMYHHSFNQRTQCSVHMVLDFINAIDVLAQKVYIFCLRITSTLQAFRVFYTVSSVKNIYLIKHFVCC